MYRDLLAGNPGPPVSPVTAVVTVVLLVLAASGVFGRELLVISGPSGGRPAVVAVSAVSRAVLEDIRSALIAAGATPGG